MIQIEIFNETDDISEAICRDYWKLTDDGEFAYRVADVCKEHSVPQPKLSKLLRASCRVQDDAIKCDGCDRLFLISTRSEWLSLRRQPRRGHMSRLCSDCETKRDQERAAQEAQLQKEQYEAWLAEYTRVSALIEEQYGSPPITEIDVRELPFRAAVYLLAVFNFYASDDFMVLSPRDEILSGKLAPTEELRNEMWSYLIDQELIGIHPGSSPDAFTEGRDGNLIPRLSLVSWRPIFAESSDDAAATVEDLRTLIQSKTWPTPWIEESQKLVREIALHECLNIIDKLMSERGLKPTLGPKTRSNLNLILRSCSIGQAACIISQCVKGASDYMVKEGVSRFQAANSVPNQLLRRFQWLSDKYDNLYSFKRTADNLESEVSHVLFNLALHAGSDWFTIPLVKFERTPEPAPL